MNVLSVDLQREILSYVSYISGLKYARCSKSLCHELVAGLRIIIIRKEDYLISESYRNKILGLILDPYRQLSLDFNYRLFTVLSPKERLYPDLILKDLFIDLKRFTKLFPHIKQLHHLSLTWKEGDRGHSIPHISGLKKLSLYYCPNSLVPSLSTNAQLLDLGSLQSLTLSHCPSISDVSCLSQIDELQLLSCSSIFNISCLNYNKIIKVDSCPVQDYSECFRFSKVITVIIKKSSFRGDNLTTIKGINLDRLEVVQSLSINSDWMNITDFLSSTEKTNLPASLRDLRLERINSLLFIPQHHNVKEITFEFCQKVSLQNLENVRLVRINYCNQIRDWSPLQNNKNVEISNCNGFKSGKEFKNVKTFKLFHSSLDMMEDLSSVTYLAVSRLLYDEPHITSDITSTAHEEKLFSSQNNLQELVVSTKFKDQDQGIAFLFLVMRSPQLKRIVIMLWLLTTDQIENIYRVICQNFDAYYHIKMRKLSKRIILFKRNEKMKEN